MATTDRPISMDQERGLTTDDPTLSAHNFRLKTPCGDCPFLKVGGVRHGVARVRGYARYFTDDPAFTFPCHQTVDKATPRDAWTDWHPDQAICAGGLAFAENVHQRNQLLLLAQRRGWYHPAQLATRRVFDTLRGLIMANL